jgi:hypothetical protein
VLHIHLSFLDEATDFALMFGLERNCWQLKSEKHIGIQAAELRTKEMQRNMESASFGILDLYWAHMAVLTNKKKWYNTRCYFIFRITWAFVTVVLLSQPSLCRRTGKCTHNTMRNSSPAQTHPHKKIRPPTL